MIMSEVDGPDGKGLSGETRHRIAYLRSHRDEISGRLISVTARCGMMYITKQLARFNIGAGQAFLLAELFIKDDVSQDVVRCILKMDRGTITRAMQRLEDLGYISRRQDTNDRRVVRVSVTEKARKIEEEFFAVLFSWNQGILKGVSAGEESLVVSILRRMSANAEAMARGCEGMGAGE